MVSALKPLHEKFNIKRIIAQHIKLFLELVKLQWMNFESDMDFLRKKKLKSKNFTKQIAFNLIPHIDVFVDDGYTKEEWKMENETKNIK